MKRLIMCAALAILGCGGISKPDAADALRGLESACELLPLLPDSAKSKEALAACETLKKAKAICTDVVAPPPMPGNRVVLDAGAGGSGGSASQ